MDHNHLTIPAAEREAFLNHLLTNSRRFIEFSYEDFKSEVPDEELLAVEMACAFAPAPEVSPPPVEETETETCVICLTDNATALCDAGGHKYACGDCFETLRLTTDPRCPVCRAPDTVPLIIPVGAPAPAEVNPFLRREGGNRLSTPFIENIDLLVGPRRQLIPRLYPNPYDDIPTVILNLVNYIDYTNIFNFSCVYVKRELARMCGLASAPRLRSLLAYGDNSFNIFVESNHLAVDVDDGERYKIYFAVKSGRTFYFKSDLTPTSGGRETERTVLTKRTSTIERNEERLLSSAGCEKFITPRRGFYTRHIFNGRRLGERWTDPVNTE